ncbi:MAG: hypothetical protein VX278_14310 [Myxococcota bacterium]|nr:hypothetical protein [Myxococcota bacterium]
MNLLQTIQSAFQQHRDSAAVALIQQNQHHSIEVSELMFALGDWSTKWIDIRKDDTTPVTQSRLRSDNAMRFFFGLSARPNLRSEFEEEAIWLAFFDVPKPYLPIDVVPVPNLGWSTPCRRQQHPNSTIPELRRWADILHQLRVPLAPWLSRIWKFYPPNPTFLTHLALLGLSYPSAIPHSIRALICSKYLMPNPVWDVLHERYNVELGSEKINRWPYSREVSSSSPLLKHLRQEIKRHQKRKPLSMMY